MMSPVVNTVFGDSGRRQRRMVLKMVSRIHDLSSSSDTFEQFASG
jgi:hypothetical protein